MELKPGYKQTEVGVIPEDWQVDTIKNTATVRTGPFGSSLHEHDYVSNGTPIITVEHLGERGVVHSKIPMVAETDRKRLQAYSLEANDIVFSRVGSVDRNSLINQAEAGWLFSGRLLRIRPNSKRIFSPYLSHYFHDEAFKQRVRSVAVGQTMPSLNTQIVNGLHIALSPLPEQRAIAAALSDTDALLSRLERLLAKKRDIKQAVMQQLLTGKQRLPGFRGEWTDCLLGDLGTFKKGKGVKKDDVVSDGLPCIRYGEIYTRHHNYIKEFHSHIPRSIADSSQRLKKGDLLFTGSGETSEDIGKCVSFMGDEEAYAGGDIVLFSPVKQNSLYLGYLMNQPGINAQKSKKGQGDAVVHISAGSLAQLQICLPPLSEQTAIAAVLSDMDAEIDALQQRRDKIRAVKQGMMQELLTGRTRLI